MKLIYNKDLQLGKTGILSRIQTSILYPLLGAGGINRLYRKTILSGKPFQRGLLDELDIQYQVSDRDLEQIPSSGAAIVVANHPTGALDGVLLIDLLIQKRPDVRFMGNFILERIAPLKKYFINVDPFDRNSGSNVSGIRNSMEHLRNGGLLVIFPAGEVATWQRGFSNIKDKPWEGAAIRFIHKMNVPVTPLWISGQNSCLFHCAGKIHPILRTALLPRELLNKRGERVTIRIGSPLTIQKAPELTNSDTFGFFLRANVEYMGAAILHP